MRTELDARAMTTLSGGHLATDFAAGGVAALLPFFVDRFDLSYTLTAVLFLCSTVASSFVQPAFGLLSDRAGALWLIPFGTGLAGVGIGLAAIAPSYPLVLVLVFASGIGIAAFHPEATKFAALASGLRRARGMSYFNIGGNAGYALAPILITPLVLWLGLAGGLVAALPVLVFALYLWRYQPRLRALEETGSTRFFEGIDRPGAMTVLTLVVVLRTVAWFGLLTFVPLWIVSEGGTEGEGNRELAVMLVAGAIGTLLIGRVADRLGLRTTLLATQVAIAPLMLVFVLVGGVAGTAALAVIGMCVVGTFGVTTVLGQQYLPCHVGVSAGLTIGLAIGLGGVASVAIGALADAVDLRTALLASTLAPLVGVLLCLALPAPAPLPRLDAKPATSIV
jgi:FSR family fosmidomycin resistance protein-like MFS transporter